MIIWHWGWTSPMVVVIKEFVSANIEVGLAVVWLGFASWSRVWAVQATRDVDWSDPQ